MATTAPLDRKLTSLGKKGLYRQVVAERFRLGNLAVISKRRGASNAPLGMLSVVSLCQVLGWHHHPDAH